MEVEHSIETLGYFVVWLFSELYCVFTKLLVIVGVYRRATLPKTIRPCLTYFILEGQIFDLFYFGRSNIPQWTRFGKLLGHVT